MDKKAEELIKNARRDNSGRLVFAKAEFRDVDFSGANLEGADFSYSDLRDVDFSNANLNKARFMHSIVSFANFSNAKMKDVDFENAAIFYTVFTKADLYNATFSKANLLSCKLNSTNCYGCIFIFASMNYVIFDYANINYAWFTNCSAKSISLKNARMKHAEFAGASFSNPIMSKAEEKVRLGRILNKKITGWKKCSCDRIIRLEIPAGAIVFSINNGKCRTNKAIVKEVIGGNKALSVYDPSFVYREGDTLEIKDFDLRYNVECANGIHFFRTREEAENYNFY